MSHATRRSAMRSQRGRARAPRLETDALNNRDRHRRAQPLPGRAPALAALQSQWAVLPTRHGCARRGIRGTLIRKSYLFFYQNNAIRQCPSHSGWHGPGHGPGHGNSEARWSDGVRTQRDAPGRGPRCHCGTVRPALVALRAAATSAPRAHPRCRRAGAVKPCRSGAHGPAGARPGKGASEHGQANNDAWLNNDTWPRADGQVVGGRTGAARPRTRSRTMWPS